MLFNITYTYDCFFSFKCVFVFNTVFSLCSNCDSIVKRDSNLGQQRGLQSRGWYGHLMMAQYFLLRRLLCRVVC